MSAGPGPGGTTHVPQGTELVVHGGHLATPQGQQARRGEEASRILEVPHAVILGRGGTVSGVCSGQVDGAELRPRGVEVLDARGGAIIPGFVDCHTHAAFAGSREGEMRDRLGGATYQEIARAGGGILSTVAATRVTPENELTGLLVGRLRTMLLRGTTTAEVKSGYGLDRETELKQLRAVATAGAVQPVSLVATFLGAHAVPLEMRHARADYLTLLVEDVLPAVVGLALAEFCDVFCERGVFTTAESRRVLEAAARLGLKLKVHADELEPSGAAELAAEMGATSAEHLMKASDAGVAALSRAGVVAVLLPTTSLFLREPYADAARFRRAGCAVAVSTDFNPGTSPAASVPLVAALACLGNGLTPEEALTAVTLNAAAALGRAATIGSVETGKAMDLVVLEDPSYVHLVYHLGVSRVRHVVKGGRVVVRDGLLVE